MFIIYNPQIDCLIGTLPYFKLRGRKSSRKYGFLVSEAKNREERIYAYVDYTACSFLPCSIFSRLPKFLRAIVSEFDYFIWKLSNPEIPVVRFRERNKSNSVLIAFMWRNFENTRLENEIIKNLNSFKNIILHTTHYFMNAEHKFTLVRKINNKIYAGDNDIRNNTLFKKLVGCEQKNFLILGFAVQKRFEQKSKFNQRLNKCIATGTLIEIDNEPHLKRHKLVKIHLNSDTYHPGRKFIHENVEKYNRVDSVISLFRGSKSKAKIRSLIDKFSVSQKEYHSLDLVEIYNKYKFAYNGSEITGGISLGNFEAMSCGCVLFIHSEDVAGMNLLPWIHFVPISKEIEEFEQFITNFDKSGVIEKAENISYAAKQYVDTYMTETAQYIHWAKTIKQIEKDNSLLDD